MEMFGARHFGHADGVEKQNEIESVIFKLFCMFFIFNRYCRPFSYFLVIALTHRFDPIGVKHLLPVNLL
jgi:hypothetical protein